jgi:uncharacterized membrane protein
VLGFTNLDYAALAFFLVAWVGYHAALELTPAGQKSLNKVMNQYRYQWMEQMVVRENRIVDTTILAFGEPPTRMAWDVKVGGLAVIFVYAFFKFAWSYRLFNYMAIMVGAVPVLKESSQEEALAVARQAGAMNAVAGKHFNRGQRAFFFSLAYLGWFVSAYLFMVATAGVLIVMWRRQFLSDAREAAVGQFDV